MALCAVLVLCLLGFVYFLTGQYHRQVVNLIETQAYEMAQKVELWVELQPETGIAFDSLPDDLKEHRDGGRLRLEVLDDEEGLPRATHRLSRDGYVSTSVQFFPIGDGQWIEATMVAEIDPQTAILRTFNNRYLAALAAAFFVALGSMIYLIAKTLRPLRELAETCARISSGELSDVVVTGNSGEILALEETFNGMVASLREKEIVETNLRQAQRLSAIGNLAAGVAHDVRNPLNAIKLLSSHALDTLEDNAASEVPARQIRTIQNEVIRLEGIVSGFLSLAKEEELHREMHPIDPTLEECVRLVEKDAETRKVRFVSELRAGDTPLFIDRRQLSRAIINVLINALEACPAGGRVRLFSRVTDQGCEVEVRDDGSGMSKEVIERVFDPYFTTKDSGTGLGLSITRGIIEEHGGTITISSSEGQGCQVLIGMPLPIEQTAGGPHG